MIRSGFYSGLGALSSHDEHALDTDTGSQVETLVDNITETSENTSQQTTEELAVTQLEPCRVPELTALHLAASMGLAKVAAMVLSETPDIDAVDETGNTALAVAMERGFEKAVEFLVNSGACVDLRDHHGQNVLLLVTERGWDSVVEIVAQKARETLSDNDDSAEQDCVRILLAAYYGDTEGIQQMVAQARVNLEIQERNIGALALFIAVERGHIRSVASLLAAGVDVESRDFAGQTSLHRATRRKNEALMRLLLERGAATEAKNDDGRTAFSANARSCDEYYANILLDAGADPNIKAHDGISQIYEAAAEGEVEYVKFLLKCGTSPSNKTRYGWAPMHWAAYQGHIQVVKLLVDAGAELSPVSDQDSTPLDMALRTNQLEVVDFLTRAGAKKNHDIPCKADTTTPAEAIAKLKLSEELLDMYSIPNLAPVDLSNPPNKISLVFDTPLYESQRFGQFVYPANFPGNKDYFYHISHPLDTIIDSIGIRKTKRRADMTDYPIAPEKFFPTNVIYEIVHFSPDYQDLNIYAKSPSAPYGMIKMQRGWTGNWKVHYDHDGTSGLVFRTTPDWSKTQNEGNRWATDDGKLLAKSGTQTAKGGREEISKGVPTLTFERGLERKMEDLLVACWVAKIWSETVMLQKLEGKSELNK
jgi:ankyrin repeat protein